MQSEIRRRDGGKLAYDHWPNEGPALMLVPGSWSTASQYDAVRRYLDDRVNLVVVELPGHGRSWPPVLEGSIQSFGQDVLRVVAQLGWKSWYVGGHSIGGMVAIELAGRRPAEIAGAISIEGWTHHRVLDDAFSGQLYETLSEAQEKQRQQERIEGLARLSKQQRAAFARLWTEWDGEPILRSTRVPVLQLWGDRNCPRPTRQQLRIPDRDGIELQWMAGASHALPLENPRQIAVAINRFLGLEESAC